MEVCKKSSVDGHRNAQNPIQYMFTFIILKEIVNLV